MSTRLALRTTSTGARYLDITEEMRIDHENVRDLYDRYQRASDRNLKDIIANTLIQEMALHIEAEEMSVYNAYAAIGLGEAAARNKEGNAEIKACVYDADVARLSVGGEYDVILSCAVSAFLEHAKLEEDELFPILREKLSPEASHRVARAFLKARTRVPRRPHLSGPQMVADKPARIQASMVVETIERPQYVELMHHHPTV